MHVLLLFIFSERGLKSIESETHNSNGGQRVLADSTYSHSAMDNNTTNSAASDGMAPHLLYLDRLKKLRAQAGLERGGSASSSSVTSSSSGIGTASSGSAYRISVVSENYSSRGYSNLTSWETETESTSSTLTAGSQSQANPSDVDAICKQLDHQTNKKNQDDDFVEIVGVVKPRHERTPEIIDLSSEETEASSDDQN